MFLLSVGFSFFCLFPSISHCLSHYLPFVYISWSVFFFFFLGGGGGLIMHCLLFLSVFLYLSLFFSLFVFLSVLQVSLLFLSVLQLVLIPHSVSLSVSFCSRLSAFTCNCLSSHMIDLSYTRKCICVLISLSPPPLPFSRHLSSMSFLFLPSSCFDRCSQVRSNFFLNVCKVLTMPSNCLKFKVSFKVWMG